MLGMEKTNGNHAINWCTSMSPRARLLLWKLL